MTANRRIRSISVTVPPSPPIAASPGNTITTLSGQATVTRLEQVGNEAIAWADYGSGIEQPHTGEAISPHPKGAQFQDKRKQVWMLVSGNAEEATLNRETEGGCISSRLTWEEIDRRFILIPHATSEEPRTDPAGQSNPRRRRRASGNRNSGNQPPAQSRRTDNTADVLPTESKQASEAEQGQQTGVSLESPLEQGDLIWAKSHDSEEWHQGYITRLGRTYARLNNDCYTVVLEGAELLERNPLPYHLLKIVGLGWEDQADTLLDHLDFANLRNFYVAGKATPLEEYRGWTIAVAPHGSKQELEISKGYARWFLRDKQHDRLKTDDRRMWWCRHAVDHVERQLVTLEALTTGKPPADFPNADKTPESVNQSDEKTEPQPGDWMVGQTLVEKAEVAGQFVRATRSGCYLLDTGEQRTDGKPSWKMVDAKTARYTTSPQIEPTTETPRIDSQLPLEPKFKVGDRVRIIELAGRNRKWLHAEAEVVEVSPHCLIRVWDDQFEKYHTFHWHPDWLERIEVEPAPQNPPSLPPLECEAPLNPPNLGDIAEATHDAIARLEQERDAIKAEGAIAPEGCWIERGKVKGRNFVQVWWRASKPLFTPKRSRGNVEAKVKSQYIGEEGSPEHKEALAQRERRDRLKAIEKQLFCLYEDLMVLDGMKRSK